MRLPANTCKANIIKRFQKALTEFGMIDDGDRILVGLSGGKDSLCLLEMLAQRMKIFKPRFTMEAVHVRMANIDYEPDTKYLEDFSASLGIKLHIRTASFDASTDKRKTPCFLCSWNRRKQMFSLAREGGFNKIALGHHNDDIIHTAMMNEYFQGRYDSMPVLLKMRKMPISIIRPLCLVCEKDIKEYAEVRKYERQKKLCPFEGDTKRAAVKSIFEKIETVNPEARYSVWNALKGAGKLVCME